MIYKCLNKQVFSETVFEIVPIRYEDRLNILKWRNEQIYHLRQDKPLTVQDQENYFNNTVSLLFDQARPNQILFSYLENDVCIGYGGLVHINWIDRNAEISFVMDTELEKDNFQKHWCNYLKLIESVAFCELRFKKIFTFAFDLRPNLYEALAKCGFKKEAVLKDHCLFNEVFFDVVIHSKFNIQKESIKKDRLYLREVTIKDAELLFIWANEIDVRNNSINQEPIFWEKHSQWFISKLYDSDTKILVLTYEDKSLGQIRIDYIDAYWVIDYSIDSRFRGQGFGKEIVKLLLNKFNSFKFKAIVKKQNNASINIFINLGFKRIDVESEDFYYFEH